MKLFLLCFLGSLVLAASIATPSNSTTSTVSCKGINPILVGLNASISAYQTPVKPGTKICGGLWQKEGTCCKPEEAIAWATQDSKKIDTDMDTLVRSYYQLSTQIDYLKKASGKEGNGSFNFLKEFKFDYLSKRLHSGQIKNFDTNMRECWGLMKTARSASMCFICAGNSPHYFFQSKAAVSSENCAAVVKGCTNYFSSTVGLLNDFSKLVTVIRGHLILSPADSNSFQWLDQVEAILKSENIAQMLEEIQGKVTGKKQQFNNPKNALCNQFYKLVKRPFISDIIPLVVGLTKNLRSIIAVQSAPQRRLAGVDPLSRQLLYTTTSTSTTPSSTCLTSLSSSADSFVMSSQSLLGSTSTHTIETQQIHSGVNTMNLTLIFP